MRATQKRFPRMVINSPGGMLRALNRIRAADDITIEALAQQVGVDRSTVQTLFLTEDANVDPSTVLRIIDALGFQIELVPKRRGSTPKRR